MHSLTDFLTKEKGIFKDSLFGFLPHKIVVPFNHGRKIEGKCIVKAGDEIREGTILSVSSCGLNIHSSIPGVVTEISNAETPDGLHSLSATISLKGEFDFLGKKLKKNDWRLLDGEKIRSELNGKGIINTFLENNPLAEEIKEKLKRKRKTILCVRLFDADPSIATESFVSEKYYPEVFEGAAIIAKACGAWGVVFIADRHSKNQSSGSDDFDGKNEKLDKISDIKDEKFGDIPIQMIRVRSEKYPVGLKNNIIKVVRSKSTNEVLKNLNHKDLFVDSLTCFTVYKALVFGMPFVSQFVHLTGDCLKSSAIMNVRLGTPIEDLVEMCGGFRRKLEKVVINGLVLGTQIDSMKIPVTKNVKSITFLPKYDTDDSHFTECVRCGNCRRICPSNLEPDTIFRHFIRNENSDSSSIIMESSLLCSGCSLCNAVCEGRLPLSQTLKMIKNNIQNSKLEGEKINVSD